MVSVPQRYNQPIMDIIDWHLYQSPYMPCYELDTRLKRIIEHFFEKNLTNNTALLEEKELYYLKQCLSDAIEYESECGVAKETIQNIIKWVDAERVKNNV